MKHIEIDLNAPFETSLALALSLPRRGEARTNNDEAVAEALRYLYTIAHGRAVETTLGPVAIAPAIDPSLKDAPLRLHSRSDLFALAEQRTNTKRLMNEHLAQARDRQLTCGVAVHITPHNVRVGPVLREFIQRKVSAVSRVAGDSVAAEVVLRGRSGATHLFSVSARVALPGRDLQGNASHSNLYGAINQLVAKLSRLARKRKTRLSKPRRRPGRRAVTPWLGRTASLCAL